MTVLIADMNCDGGGFSPPYLGENGPTAVVSLAVPQRFMRSASSAGRWNGVMAGWTTGVGWSLGTTGIPNPTLPF